MSNIVEFPHDQGEDCCKCPSCDLADEFFLYARNSQSDEELREVLRGLVEEAKILGFKECLMQDLDMKLKLLNHMECDCEECNGDCEIEE